MDSINVPSPLRGLLLRATESIIESCHSLRVLTKNKCPGKLPETVGILYVIIVYSM